MTAATTHQSIEDTAKAIRWLLIGGLLCEYGARMLPSSRGELKMRTNAVINFSKRLQEYFVHHPNCSQENKKVFLKEFSKNEVVLIGELVETVWGIKESDLENIIDTLKKHIVDHG